MAKLGFQKVKDQIWMPYIWQID